MKRTLAERDRFVALKIEIFNEIAEELDKGAAGPCDYWFRELATRLQNRAIKLADQE